MTIQSQQAIKETMSKMSGMIKTLCGPTTGVSLYKTIAEFEKQNQILDNTSDLVNETLEGVFETEDEDSKTDTEVQKILAELGLNTSHALPRASSSQPEMSTTVGEDDDLEKRLQRLKNG